MTKRMLIAGTTAAALLGLADPRPTAASCLTCSSSQYCMEGSQGTSCTTYYDNGQRWCQFSTDCGRKAVTMTPLDVSPTGTYLAGGTVEVKDGMEREDCSGFIVRHLASEDAEAGSQETIRI